MYDQRKDFETVTENSVISALEAMDKQEEAFLVLNAPEEKGQNAYLKVSPIGGGFYEIETRRSRSGEEFAYYRREGLFLEEVKQLFLGFLKGESPATWGWRDISDEMICSA